MRSILVIGAKNSGKTSFINFLKASLAMPPHKQALRAQDSEYTPTISKTFHNFTHHYQEIDVDHERVGLTLWDSEGLEKGLIDLQLRDLTSFVESKFEETFAEENKVLRSPGARDTQIHVIFMVLDPSRLATNLTLAEKNSSSNLTRGGKTTRIVGALDEDFELQVLKSFQGKATVVPVISKADTVTTAQMQHLKKMVWQGFKIAGLDPLEALNIVQESEDELDEEDEDNVQDDQHGSEDGSPPVTPHSEDSEAFHDTNDGQPKPQPTHKRNTSKTSISSQMMDIGYVPMSILSPDDFSLDPTTGRIGRRFPWGFADPFDPIHCDFVKLKEAVFNEWRNEVREASREIFYERWRTNRLNRKAAAPRVQGSSPIQTRKPSGGIPIELKPTKYRTETL